MLQQHNPDHKNTMAVSLRCVFCFLAHQVDVPFVSTHTHHQHAPKSAASFVMDHLHHHLHHQQQQQCAVMEQQHMYKRTWREPAPALTTEEFKVLWKKQRLAEVREAILRGDWPSPLSSDSDSDGEGGGSASTSCTNSPRHGSHHRRHSQPDGQESEEDPELEAALQEAADSQLQAVLTRLQDQHTGQLQASRAAAKVVEEEHTTATKQVDDIQAQLEELKRNKHELFQQLKLVSWLWERSWTWMGVALSGIHTVESTSRYVANLSDVMHAHCLCCLLRSAGKPGCCSGSSSCSCCRTASSLPTAAAAMAATAATATANASTTQLVATSAGSNTLPCSSIWCPALCWWCAAAAAADDSQACWPAVAAIWKWRVESCWQVLLVDQLTTAAPAATSAKTAHGRWWWWWWQQRGRQHAFVPAAAATCIHAARGLPGASSIPTAAIAAATVCSGAARQLGNAHVRRTAPAPAAAAVGAIHTPWWWWWSPAARPCQQRCSVLGVIIRQAWCCWSCKARQAGL